MENLHLFSLGNEHAIMASLKCGCFHCKNIFDSGLITEWIDDINARTALCPFCGVDAVLPDSNIALTEELLARMQTQWFG